MPRPPDKIAKSLCVLETDRGSFAYCWNRSGRRRTLAISVDAKAQVSVFSPWHVGEAQVGAFVRQKAGWVLEKVQKGLVRLELLNGRRLEDGRELLFLGKRYPLRVREARGRRGSVRFGAQGWTAELPAGLSAARREDEIRRRLARWYRAQAAEMLGARVFRFAPLVGAEPRRVEVRAHKRVWGNCDFNSKTVRLNWQIIFAPPEVIDYVVVHELCHLHFPNHSKRFWMKVSQVLPDFKCRKAWLKDNAWELSLP